jgi:site-specific DNA-methyltransferase (adenine-specific)
MGIIKISKYLEPNIIYHGDVRILLPRIEPNSISLSVWSPPYFVGKDYEKDLSFDEWKNLLKKTVFYHYELLKPGGFLVINISDILCFKDTDMPRIMAENVSRRKIALTKEEILKIKEKHPNWNKYQLADYFKCSEQTIDRRLKGNNIRGGKYQTQTRVFVVGGFIQEIALEAGLYAYDRRIWVKDAAWKIQGGILFHIELLMNLNIFIYIWKPGVTKVDRSRITKEEWINWGSRAVWHIPSVRSNNDHDSKFPVELPQRIIKLFSDKDDIVLDCFIGSGTTAIAALLENRQFIGIDKENKSVQLANKSIKSFINSNNNKIEKNILLKL